MIEYLATFIALETAGEKLYRVIDIFSHWWWPDAVRAQVMPLMIEGPPSTLQMSGTSTDK
jgi:hypothetical protein